MKLSKEKRNISGPRILEERQRQGLTRKALLAKAEVYGLKMSPRTLSLLERQNRVVYDKELIVLSTVLNVSMDWLLGLEEPSEKASP